MHPLQSPASALTLASILLSPIPLEAASYSWGSTVSGTWGSPVFWTPSTGFPNGAGDTASLSATGGPYDVILDGNYSVGQFTHNGDGNFTATAKIFTVDGNSTLAGDSTIFTNSTYVSNGTFSHVTGPIDLINSTITGSGSFSQSGGFLNLDASEIYLPGSMNGGTIFMVASCTLSGGFNNIGGLLDLYAPTDVNRSGTLHIGANDLENSGTIRLRSGPPGTYAPNLTLSSTGGALRNYGAGIVEIQAGAGGSRSINAQINNEGGITSNATVTGNRNGAAHTNSGAIGFSAGDFSLSGFESLNNSGSIQATAGSLGFMGNGAAASNITNTPSGSMIAGGSISLGSVLAFDNDGTIQSGGNFSVNGYGSNAVTFDHSGSLTVGPGGGFSMSTGHPASQFIVQPGATFLPGDFVSLYLATLVLNEPVSLGSAPLTMHRAGLSGGATVTTTDGIGASFRAATLTAPVSNHGDATVTSGGTAGLQNSYFYGPFTNEVDGSFSIDSAPDGYVIVNLNNNDFTNKGPFSLTGSTTTTLQLANGSSSTGTFVNDTTGTVTIDGTGARNFDVPIDNRGTFNILTSTDTNSITNAVHSNSGTLTAAADWDVNSMLSLSNSGDLISTGGVLTFYGNNGAASLFDNSGTMTFANGGIVTGFEDLTNSGTLNLISGTTTINVGTAANPQQFVNSGGIDVSPGAALSLYGPGGKDDGLVSFGTGSTLGGGGPITFNQVTVSLDGAWDPGDSPPNLYRSSLIGPGTLNLQDGLPARFRTMYVNAPVTNHADATVEATGTSTNIYNYIYGPFTNETDGSVSLDSSIGGYVILTLGNNDFTNHGAFSLTGNTTTTLQLANGSTSTATFVNESTGTVTIDGSGQRNFDVPIDNRGIFDILSSTSTNGITDAVHANSGTLTAAADWSVTSVLSLTNSGDLVSTGGLLTLSGNNNAASLFDNSGTLTFANGGTVSSFENLSNSGTLNIAAGTTTFNIGGASNPQQFVNSGDIEVSPGASLTLYGPGGKDDAALTLATGSTLDGGGALTLNQITATLDDAWDPGTSPPNFYRSSLVGPGTLNLQDGLPARFRTMYVTTPVTNHADATVEATGSSGNIYNYFYGPFTNEADGSVSLDSSIGGYVILFLGNNDFTNHGAFSLTGNTTTTLQLANGSTSTATFVNEPTGTVTIGGTGQRNFDVPIDNRGTFDILSTTSTNGITDAVHANSGTLTAAADWSLTSVLSLTNSGDLVSTGGALSFTGNNNAASLFDNSGTLTFANGGTVSSFENLTNSGTLNVAAGTATFNIGGASNPQQFVNGGDIEVSPGASLTLYGPGGTDDGAVEFGAGSTLDGGGNITLNQVTATLADPWNPGSSPLNLYRSTLTGAGSLATADGVDARFRTMVVNVPVSNHANATVEATGSSGYAFNYIYAPFSNEIDGEVSLDSSIGGFVYLYLHNADLSNHGVFAVTGNTTTRVLHVNTSSTCQFVNSATGTLTIGGSGSRDFELSLDNQGTTSVETTCDFGDTNPLTTLSNSGQFIIAAGATANVVGDFVNQSGGTIGGNGTLNTGAATSVTHDGTIAPGTSVGSLTVNGNLAATSSAKFDCELSGNGGAGIGHDFLQVNGSLTLEGTLRPLALNGFVPSPSDSFVIMQCTGTLAGDFAGIEQPFPFGTFVADVDPATRQVTLSFALTGPLSYEDYQTIYFTPEQIANGDADRAIDFDNDGIVNELEWIHGFDPTDPFRPAPPLRIERVGADLDLIFLESDLLPASVQMQVLTGTDLASPFVGIPTGDTPRTDETPLPGYPNISEVTLHLTNPAWTGSAARFFELEFTDTAP